MLTRSTFLAIALATLAAGAFAAPVSAGTVELRTSIESVPKGPAESFTRLVYTASPGETNTVELGSGGGRLSITDATAPLEAGDGCTAQEPGHVTCAGAVIVQFLFDLGDGNDRFAPSFELGTGVTVLAGPGDDTVTGTIGPDSLDGGGGRDTLDAGRGSDTLRDGDTSGAADGDVLQGGPDADKVSYAERTAAMTADLGAGTAGEAGEPDQIPGIEAIETGSGDDALTGTDGPDSLSAGAGANSVDGHAGNDQIAGAGRLLGADGNDTLRCFTRCDADGGPGDDKLDGTQNADQLTGGPGSDLLIGMAGDDTIGGGDGDDTLRGDSIRGTSDSGRDSLDGGAGNDNLAGGPGVDSYSGGDGSDRIVARDTAGEQVDCGAGADSAALDARDTPAACELSTRTIRARVTKVRTSDFVGVMVVNLRVACPASAAVVCRGRVTLSDASGRRFGRASWSASAGDFEDLDVNLPRPLARRARAGRSIRIGLRATISDRAGAGIGLRRRVLAPRER